MKFFLLILKNVGRSPLRSILTALGTMVLVFVVTLVWTVLNVLAYVTTEKSKDFRALVTERWSVPSRMPYSYAASLADGAARNPGDVKPVDSMTWQFFGGTVDKDRPPSRDNIVFAIALDPAKIMTMLEGMETLSPEQTADLQKAVDLLKIKRQGIILGNSHMVGMKKHIGDRITLFGFGNFKGLELKDFEIVGSFPPGRYDTLAAFNRDYYNNLLDMYPQQNGGRQHPLAARSLSMVWLKLPDTASFTRVAAQIESSPFYMAPALRCETAASGIASMLEGFRDLIWGMQWLLAPACLVTLSLVIANAISISVRERRTELAVLKVLGFRPSQILMLVLGESLLLGVGSGFGSALITYVTVNWIMGGLKFPIAFISTFMIPGNALWWGAGMGAITALAGSIVPAWSARNVKVADVFSKVA
jgi:putative ABC transport system permease protein